jgi:hypothetical protein
VRFQATMMCGCNEEESELIHCPSCIAHIPLAAINCPNCGEEVCALTEDYEQMKDDAS